MYIYIYIIIYIYIYTYYPYTIHILSIIYYPYTIYILFIYYPFTIHILSIYTYSFICFNFIVSQWAYIAVYSWGHHIVSRKCDFSDIEVKVKTMLVGSAVELGDMGGKCEKCLTWASP